MTSIRQIAHIESGFEEKFGIPRQSGLVPDTIATIIFEKEFRNPDFIKGIEEYSHLWLIWNFSESKGDNMKPLVTPPRLGGKEKKGVFATRSPFRPNPIGLSSVKLLEVRLGGKRGPELIVSGADLLDQTPIFDIKPYLTYTDCHEDARSGFGDLHRNDGIEVSISDELLDKIPKNIQNTIINILAQDPRASYNKMLDYVYGLRYEGYDIRFVVEESVLKVVEVVDASKDTYRKVK